MATKRFDDSMNFMERNTGKEFFCLFVVVNFIQILPSLRSKIDSILLIERRDSCEKISERSMPTPCFNPSLIIFTKGLEDNIEVSSISLCRATLNK